MNKAQTTDLVKLSRLTSNEIRASYTPGSKCDIKSSQFQWTLYDDSKYVKKIASAVRRKLIVSN